MPFLVEDARTRSRLLGNASAQFPRRTEEGDRHPGSSTSALKPTRSQAGSESPFSPRSILPSVRRMRPPRAYIMSQAFDWFGGGSLRPRVLFLPSRPAAEY